MAYINTKFGTDTGTVIGTMIVTPKSFGTGSVGYYGSQKCVIPGVVAATLSVGDDVICVVPMAFKTFATLSTGYYGSAKTVIGDKAYQVSVQAVAIGTKPGTPKFGKPDGTFQCQVTMTAYTPKTYNGTPEASNGTPDEQADAELAKKEAKEKAARMAASKRAEEAAAKKEAKKEAARLQKLEDMGALSGK